MRVLAFHIRFQRALIVADVALNMVLRRMWRGWP